MKHKKGRDAGGESNGDGGSQKGGSEVPLSIQLNIVEHPGGGDGGNGLGTGGGRSASFFEPWRE